MAIRPLHDRVVVRRIEAETRSTGGIVIPDSASEKPDQGEVVAVGPGAALDDGTVRPVGVSVGERVLFARYAGTEVTIGGETLLVVKESEILAVVDGLAEVEQAA
jgi:chaperonin GroES